MNINLLFGTAFSISLFLFILLYILSKGKYEKSITLINEKEFKLKTLPPVGLHLMYICRYNYATKYDRYLIIKLTGLHGSAKAGYYLQIHWANKIVLIFTVTIIMFLFGATGNLGLEYGVFCLVVIGGIFYFLDRELSEKIKRRKLEIQIYFPEFLNKLTLLINAGLTISRAWEKIVSDNKKEGILFEELTETIVQIKSGKSEFEAYEAFAQRCRVSEVTKFISIIMQNMKKGNDEIVVIFRYLANECWETRKNVARRYGEEASTRMLLPMMIMFLAILAIVAVPAILSMQGI